VRLLRVVRKFLEPHRRFTFVMNSHLMISMFVTFSVPINQEHRGPAVLEIYSYRSHDFTILNFCYQISPTQLVPLLLHVYLATGSSLTPKTGDPDQIFREFPQPFQHSQFIIHCYLTLYNLSYYCRPRCIVRSFKSLQAA